MVSKKNLFKTKRHWYHVSTTLKRKKIHLIPWDESKSTNRSGDEPEGARICVAPTIEQCITAIPYYMDTLYIYKTENMVLPRKAIGVYDAHITDEGWLEEPTTFVKIGTLYLNTLARKLKQEDVISESASSDSLEYCREVLRWWRKSKIDRFIKTT